MRISVCEYLRLMTNKNWCYLEPGLWISSNWNQEAHRHPTNPDILTVYTRKGEKVRTLNYFKGESHNVVRTLNKPIIQKLRAKKGKKK